MNCGLLNLMLAVERKGANQGVPYLRCSFSLVFKFDTMIINGLGWYDTIDQGIAQLNYNDGFFS